MKTLILSIIAFVFTSVFTSITNSNTNDAFTGAWETTYKEGDREVRAVAILSGGYISAAAYYTDDNSFFYTMGGSYKIDGDKVTQVYEFNTMDATKVGKTDISEFKIKGDELTFVGDARVWKRIDNGTGGDLADAFLITGRKRDGEISRSTPGARKTMKILSGTRFQWIAYNVDNGQFSGTGGGTYTTINGKYVENIEFFSRDVTRVGASLSFDYEVKDSEWHHSGLSSKGDPIYEIWTPRAMLK
ncbi:MAG: membrane or secreted protein [Cytophagales bacterium CG17_big_fil_post_rev_8_21_14_2_50_40_13]|nr:MAG: membrane or secreted protein [Cytophagales bacterium CG17_big_fil_post_rev_8_21_14_2_50_40_13]